MLMFANPGYLYFLILVPCFWIGYAALRYFRKRRIARFADKEMAAALMPSVSTAKGWVRVVLFSLAFGLFIIGCARPRTGAKLTEFKGDGVEIIVCLDVSNSMRAQDYSPCRLERAKWSLSQLVDKLAGDRIGLVVFAGTSFVQLPVTTDYVSAKMFLSTVSTNSVQAQGTAIGHAIATAAKAFSAQNADSRAIIVITDGENHDDDAVAVAESVHQEGIRVFTIGVGSEEGKYIPMEGGDYLKDKDGKYVVTKLDSKGLADIAAAGGGLYVKAGVKEFGLNPIVDDIRNMSKEEFSSVMFEEYNELYMYFFAVAFVLLVLEMLVGMRKWKFSIF